MRKQVVIVGAGSAGQAVAARLALHSDNQVSLVDNNPKIVAALDSSKRIYYDGLFGRGEVEIQGASTDPSALVSEATAVIITTTADRHSAVANAIAPYLQDGQVVLLHPGYCFGAMWFRQKLAKTTSIGRPHIAETCNTLHLSTLTSLNAVFIKAEKQWMQFACHPSGSEDEVLAVLGDSLPQLQACENTLTVGLNNPNPVVHVPALIFNGAKWGNVGPEASGALYFGELVNDVVSQASRHVDKERLQIMNALKLPGISLEEFDARSYPEGSRVETNVPRVGRKLLNRFVFEDIPCGLVPLAELGRRSKTPTPTIDLLIQASRFIASTPPEQDRTLERLGLKDSSITEIVSAAR